MHPVASPHALLLVSCPPHDVEQAVASAAIRNNTAQLIIGQRAHHAPDKGAFLPRVLVVEPEHSATKPWALLELASWCENG